MEVLQCCEEMGMLRSRHVLRERTAVCFALWSEGAAQQRLAEQKVTCPEPLSPSTGQPCCHAYRELLQYEVCCWT